MAKDFKLMAEAYTRVYEANGMETGSLGSGSQSAQPQQSVSQPPVAPGAPVADTSQSVQVQLSNSDASKILKNISEVYRKTKEIAEVLKKNNMPGAMESFNLERNKLVGLVNGILSVTPGVKDTRVKSNLMTHVDPEILKTVATAQPVSQPQTLQGSAQISQRG